MMRVIAFSSNEKGHAYREIMFMRESQVSKYRCDHSRYRDRSAFNEEHIVRIVSAY